MRGYSLFTKACAAGFAALVLAACGGGGFSNGGTTGSTTGSTTGGSTSSLAMGSFVSGAFSAGTIATAIGTSTLPVGGSSGLSVVIVDTANGNALVTTPESVSFSSPCTGAGTATITSPVTTSNGTASSSYHDMGCSGSDLITATATVGTAVLTATGTIKTAVAKVSAISFVSAAPTSIRIKGAGQPQTAVVSFHVSNNAGGPAAGQTVKFTVNTTVGGLTVTPASGVTDSSGNVQTTVNAGTVHASVQVTATVVDNMGNPVAGVPPAGSSSLTITTGVPSQNSFSISAGCFNIEGGDYDGTQTNINILSGDRFNNPAPDGTAVSFNTNGGQIPGQCLTASGGCSVNFTSSNPRPANHRTIVLATAVGEESFTDTNGNGEFDMGEPFTDLPEAWLDVNENGIHDAGEPFIDYNNNQLYDGPTGKFKGVLCNTNCDPATSLDVRKSLVIIMSGSAAADLQIIPSTIDVTNGAVAVFVEVGDDASPTPQPLPGGTKVAAATTFGTIVGSATQTQPCTEFNGPWIYEFIVSPPSGQTNAGSGVFTVDVTSPKGTITSAAASVVFNPGVTNPPPPGPLSSIQFNSATPTTIGIKGTGLTQSSTVVFTVRDNKGVPIPNQLVNFSLNTTAGGLNVTPTSASSDANGQVTTHVNSGTVHTSVRVTATATQGSGSGLCGCTVSAQSSLLTVSTGIPTSGAFSLSAEPRNIEGAELDGNTSKVTIRAADRFGNPVPDGTAVSFATDAGSIQPSCTTSGGACTVIFTTQAPRNANERNHILAYAVGEESFTDLNGNGYYDSGEPFANLPEAFIDVNETGTFAPGELFIDFNNNGTYDTGTGLFKGVLCNSGCDPANSLNVFRNIVIVGSSRNAVITVPGGPITLAPNGTTTVTVNVQDAFGQAMATGTTIVASAVGYGTVALPSGGTYVQPNSTAGGGTQNYSFVLQDSSGLAGHGVLNITVTTPTTNTKTSAQFNIN